MSSPTDNCSTTDEPAGGARSFTELTPGFEGEGGNAEGEAIEHLVTEELRIAFEELTEDQRDVLALRMIGGLTSQQTAQVMGKRIGAIKALQRRAVVALQKKLRFEDVPL